MGTETNGETSHKKQQSHVQQAGQTDLQQNVNKASFPRPLLPIPVISPISTSVYVRNVGIYLYFAVMSMRLIQSTAYSDKKL